MARTYSYLAFLFLTILLSCKSKTNSSPIDGTWIVVSNEVNNKVVTPKRDPQQLKMFHDGYFSFTMYDGDGNFHYAGAGPFSLEGNMYKETFEYASDTSDIGSSDWQRWELKGDTLMFYGFEKAQSKDGKDLTEVWGKNQFIEKRIRIKN